MEVIEPFPHGLPHVGARYAGGFAGGRLRCELTASACPVCDAARATDVHHVDPVGMGGRQSPLVKETRFGTWPLYTALFGLCRGCHAALHAGRLGAVWIWNDGECKRLWDEGRLLMAHGAHSDALRELGFWALSDGRRLL